MAYTKVHSIKVSLKKALDYIMNEKKTDGKILISGIQCTPATAYHEFKLEHKIAINNGKDFYSKENDILAKHIIQSFKIDEVTAEEAHRIGLELADELFGGKYQCVVTTHIDKNHVHNHIMVNVTNLESHKKIRDNELNWLNLWEKSNELCQKYNLSWRDPNEYREAKQKGEKYYNYQNEKTNMSYKAQLQEAIDRLIVAAKDYNEFLKLMEEEGWKYNKRGNTVSFKHTNQKKATRLSSLGKEYSEENIKARIKALHKEKDLQSEFKKTAQKYGSPSEIKKVAATISVLQKNDIHSYDVMEIRLAEIEGTVEELKDSLEKIDKQINNYNQLANKLELYHQLKLIVEGYQSAVIKKTYYKKHAEEIEMFKVVSKQLQDAGVDVDNISIASVLEQREIIKEQQKQMKNQYNQAKKELYELKMTYAHVQDIMRNHYRERAAEQKRGQEL